MLEILRTIDGLTALTLNDKVVLTMESRGHDTTELEQVAQRLGKILAIELYESQVQKNPGEFWKSSSAGRPTVPMKW